MVDVAVAGMAVVLWTVTVVRWREPHRSSAAALWLRMTLLCLAIGASLVITDTSKLLTDVTGVADLSEPIARTALLAGAFGSASLMRELTSEPRVGAARPVGRLRTGVWLLSICLLWVAFLAGGQDGLHRFASYAVASLWPAVFLIVFMAYFAYATAEVMTGCSRHARSAHGSLAVGLRLIAVGCMLGLVYVAVKLGAEAMAIAGSPIPAHVEGSLGRAFGAAAGVLVAMGVSWPSLAGPARHAVSWCRAYRAQRRLLPLWRAVITVSPGLALEPVAPRLVDCLRVRDLHLRVYRRVIEIQDARLVLRPYLSPSVRDSATVTAIQRSLTGEDARAFVEARLLESALVATTPSVGEAVGSASGTDGTLRGEVDWLVAVARAFEAPRQALLPVDRRGVLPSRGRPA